MRSSKSQALAATYPFSLDAQACMHLGGLFAPPYNAFPPLTIANNKIVRNKFSRRISVCWLQRRTRQDKTKITPVPASQADEVSDLFLIRSRLAHA